MVAVLMVVVVVMMMRVIVAGERVRPVVGARQWGWRARPAMIAVPIRPARLALLRVELLVIRLVRTR